MQRIRYECDLTGVVTSAVDHDDDDFPQLPVGWLDITVRWIEHNPDYADAVKQLEIRRAQMMAQVTASAQAQGLDVNDGQIQSDIEENVDAALANTDLPDPLVVVERTYHVAPDAADQVLGMFGEAQANVTHADDAGPLTLPAVAAPAVTMPDTAPPATPASPTLVDL